MKTISRKDFISRSALLGAAGAIGMGGIGGTILTSCSGGSSEGGDPDHLPIPSSKAVYIPEVGEKAIDGKPIRVAIIGCGGRGTGAARDIVTTGDGISIVALADLFADKAETMKNYIEKDQGVVIDATKIHFGFDAYKKVCDDPDVDMVVITSAPLFHAVQTKYAIDKGKHVFCEKPAAVDAVSGRTMMSAVMTAKAKGLSILFGTQLRHNRAYIESYRRVREGQIGRIRSAVVCRNSVSRKSAMKRKPEWTDMEYMLRRFSPWSWLSGDYPCENLIHQIDVFQWFSHLKPVSAVSMGAQVRKVQGDSFDYLSSDVVYEDNVRVLTQCRQIDGCGRHVGVTIYGTIGSWNSKDQAIRNLNGEIVWQYDEKEAAKKYKQSHYKLQYINLINHIRLGKAFNSEAESGVTAAFVASMIRESAYTGKEYKYDDYIMSDQSNMPEKLHWGNIENFEEIYVAPKMGIPFKV